MLPVRVESTSGNNRRFWWASSDAPKLLSSYQQLYHSKILNRWEWIEIILLGNSSRQLWPVFSLWNSALIRQQNVRIIYRQMRKHSSIWSVHLRESSTRECVGWIHIRGRFCLTHVAFTYVMRSFIWTSCISLYFISKEHGINEDGIISSKYSNEKCSFPIQYTTRAGKFWIPKKWRQSDQIGIIILHQRDFSTVWSLNKKK